MESLTGFLQRFLQEHGEVQLSALGLGMCAHCTSEATTSVDNGQQELTSSVLLTAISSMVTVAEILKNSRLAVEQSEQIDMSQFPYVPPVLSLALTCTVAQRSQLGLMLSMTMEGRELCRSLKWRLFCASLRSLTKLWHNKHVCLSLARLWQPTLCRQLEA